MTLAHAAVRRSNPVPQTARGRPPLYRTNRALYTLYAAVLMDAARLLATSRHADRPAAWRWVFLKRYLPESYPFSFSATCAVLGLDADGLRRELRQALATGAPLAVVDRCHVHLPHTRRQGTGRLELDWRNRGRDAVRGL